MYVEKTFSVVNHISKIRLGHMHYILVEFQLLLLEK